MELQKFVLLIKKEREDFIMYKKYLETARVNYERARGLEGYAKTVLSKDVMKCKDIAGKIGENPRLKNQEERKQQAKHLIALAFMQKIGAIKEERRNSFKEVIKAAEEAKNSMPKATPEQLAEYKEKVNDLKTELLFANDYGQKESIIKEFIKEVDNPDFATELRREFGVITRDAMNSVSGADKAKVNLVFKKYYEDLKDGINFYPEDIRKTIELARNAEGPLAEDILFNKVYTESFVPKLLNKEQLAFIENPDEYFEKQYPELMTVNVTQKIDQTIEENILQPETTETIRAAAVSSLLE